jgi:AcrR family transcriptional regulator
VRRRRPAEEARRAILDAAEKRLREGGPAGIRLQEIARDVGISHPAILHHFGSREGLMRAVIERALGALDRDLLAAFEADRAADVDANALLERAFETLGDRGHARLVAWLALSGEGEAPRGDTGRFLRRLAEATHALRPPGARRTAAGFEDTQFAVLLAAAALFGEAIVGPQMRRSAGLAGDRDASRRFRRWLADLLLRHLSSAPVAPSRRGR